MAGPDPLAKIVRVGTRGSTLARRQTEQVCQLLAAAWPGLAVAIEIVHTEGDRTLDTPLPVLGGKGVFTAELEAALRSGAIDLAVHSLKDLPTLMAQGLTVGAVPERADAADVLVSRGGQTLESLPAGAVIGTSSHRRAAQLLHRRPDLRIADIRGNVDTRLRKALAADGPYDAVVLACAGLARLHLLHSLAFYQVLPLDVMLPAPGQGALGIQCRDEAASLALLAPLDHASSRAAVTAERAFLSGLGGSCALPIAAYASVDPAAGRLHLHGRVSAHDGSAQMDFKAEGAVDDARQLGLALAQEALARSAREL